MRKIVIASQKGGTSKTTTTCNVAVGLAREGHRVLVVDCDAQANASWTLLGGKPPEGPTLASVLMRQADAEEAIRPTTRPGLEILPAESALSAVNVALVQEIGRDTRLRSALAPLNGEWDFVLVDTAPTFTTLLANAMVFGEEVIVPSDAGLYALLGLVDLQSTIAEVRDAYGNDKLRLAGLVLTKTQRNNVCRDVEAEVRSRFGDLVFKTTVPLSAKVEEAATRGLTVLEHAPHSPAGFAYSELIEEITNGRAEDRGGAPSVKRAGKVDAA
jgi:chromosome partitioning protein